MRRYKEFISNGSFMLISKDLDFVKSCFLELKLFNFF